MESTIRNRDQMRDFGTEILGFESTRGNEADAQEWFERQLSGMGFETYRWEADADELALLPEFPDAEEILVENRPSVGGVVEFGDPDSGKTLLLNGHIDVVPAHSESWDTDPFEAIWDGDTVFARGAADMKAGLTACVFAAHSLAERANELNLDGRIVVESVVGEEEGGIGAAASAHCDPYPFTRDAALIAEPTELGIVTVVEGSLMMELQLTGRSAHAATRWRGESVIPHFERIREAFLCLEKERHENLTHPLYGDYPNSWPVNIGTIDAGSWGSSVPADLRSDIRIGVAPGETLDDVEATFRKRLDMVVENNEWLSSNPPIFERRGIQFESAETDPRAEIVQTLQSTISKTELLNSEPYGATYGADTRHYINAGIPTVTFGPGTINQAHFPNEHINWSEVETATEIIAETAKDYLGDDQL